MRTILLLLFFAAQVFGAWGNGYTYRLTEAVVYTKVGETDHTDYPATYNRTYSQLAHTTHGGYATDLNGYDIIITSDSAGSTKLDHEIEDYNHETGAVKFHVRIPSVSHTANTTFYVFVGNSSVTTSQESVDSTWASAFKGVWHMKDYASMTDSSGNGNTLTATGSPTNVSTGQVNGAVDFHTTSQYSGPYATSTANSGAITSDGEVTLSTWVKFDSFVLSDNNPSRFIGMNGFHIRSSHTTTYVSGSTSGDSAYQFSGDTGAMSTDTWYHVALTKTSGGTPAVYIYVNGSLANSGSGQAIGTMSDSVVKVSTDPYGFDRVHDSTFDEVRVSNVKRSADWILTEYNNQYEPSTFFSSNGTFEENGGGGGSRKRVVIGQ